MNEETATNSTPTANGSVLPPDMQFGEAQVSREWKIRHFWELPDMMFALDGGGGSWKREVV